MSASHPSSRRAGLSRRGFLEAGAAAGGGLMLGFATGPAEAAAAVFSPNAFIRIDPRGAVTLIMPQQEMGQGIYTGLAQLLAEELDVGLNQVKVEAAPADDALYGAGRSHVQSTGGSTSIRNFYMVLRKAGAGARSMLVAAAAEQWKVPAAACRTADGRVSHPPSGRSLGYGDLTARAARLKPPADPPLKSPAEFKLIGRPARRVDTPDKVNGRAVYGIDVMAGKVRVATVRPAPTVGGKVRRVDDRKARAVPGVRQVVVLDDLVAVVADHTWAARQGLNALTVEWDDGPNRNRGSKEIWADLRAASARPGPVAKTVGDPAAALARGERLEAAYEVGFLAHAPMEPLNCTVHVRPGACEVWTGTQVQTRAQAAAAKVLGLPPKAVTLHNHMLGGAFGRRLDVDMVTNAVRVAREVEGPVKVVWLREEDMQHDMFRPAYRNVMAATLTRGKIDGWSHRVAGGSVVARMSQKPLKGGLDNGAVEGASEPPYALPHRRIEYVQAEPRAVQVGYWRGVGPNNTVFAVESFVDELAKKAGRDPLAFRLAMLGEEPRLKAALELAAQKAGWGSPTSRRVGRGICAQHVFGTYIATIAEVEVDTSGEVRVRRYVSAIDPGVIVNPNTVVAQVEGGLMFGLGAALYGDITVANGRVQQTNFNNYRVLRMHEAPPVEVHLIRNNETPGGIGEPGVTAAAPSLVNAIAAATGVRLRRLPIDRSLLATGKS